MVLVDNRLIQAVFSVLLVACPMYFLGLFRLAEFAGRSGF